jgi:hypothetical protein
MWKVSHFINSLSLSNIYTNLAMAVIFSTEVRCETSNGSTTLFFPFLLCEVPGLDVDCREDGRFEDEVPGREDEEP